MGEGGRGEGGGPAESAGSAAAERGWCGRRFAASAAAGWGAVARVLVAVAAAGRGAVRQRAAGRPLPVAASSAGGLSVRAAAGFRAGSCWLTILHARRSKQTRCRLIGAKGDALRGEPLQEWDWSSSGACRGRASGKPAIMRRSSPRGGSRRGSQPSSAKHRPAPDPYRSRWQGHRTRFGHAGKDS